MLRNSVCLVIAHMVDATQLCLSCHCTHGGCYATLFVLSSLKHFAPAIFPRKLGHGPDAAVHPEIPKW